MPMGALVLDSDFRIQHWNKCLETWTGLPMSQVQGQDIRELYPALAAPLYSGRLEALFKGGAPVIFSYHLHQYIIPAKLPDGSYRRQQCTASAMELPGAATPLIILTLQDVTEVHTRLRETAQLRDQALAELELRKQTETLLLENEEKLRRLATTDELTGVANRRMLMETMATEEVRARRYRKPLSFLMIDADHFKRINDNHGHDVGDTALTMLARTLKKQLREVDLAGRLGGEEFGILLPETGLEEALVVAERIRKNVEQLLIPAHGRKVPLTVSIGAATLRLDCKNECAEEVMRRADEALYKAKSQGRNRVATEWQSPSAHSAA